MESDVTQILLTTFKQSSGVRRSPKASLLV